MLAALGNMYELISNNQQGKPGYETYINNNVVTIAELLRDGGYHTTQTRKWHLSGNHTSFQPGTSPYDRGFDHAFILVGLEYLSDAGRVTDERYLYLISLD